MGFVYLEDKAIDFIKKKGIMMADITHKLVMRIKG
jgi:hypothetical protein